MTTTVMVRAEEGPVRYRFRGADGDETKGNVLPGTGERHFEVSGEAQLLIVDEAYAAKVDADNAARREQQQPQQQTETAPASQPAAEPEKPAPDAPSEKPADEAEHAEVEETEEEPEEGGPAGGGPITDADPKPEGTEQQPQAQA